jgi:hypothetical protein
MSKEISKFVMPEKPSGRFVQHYIDNLPFIRFSSTNEETHKEIYQSFLIDYLWAVTSPAVSIKQAAKGFYKLLQDGTIQLYGDKHVTNFLPNQEDLTALAPYLPEGIKLEIGKAV